MPGHDGNSFTAQAISLWRAHSSIWFWKRGSPNVRFAPKATTLLRRPLDEVRIGSMALIKSPMIWMKPAE
jgi:hypothetical protein